MHIETAAQAAALFRAALPAEQKEERVFVLPPGDPTPSKADYDTTVKLNDGANLVGLELIDHLILGAADSANGPGYVSMAELMSE